MDAPEANVRRQEQVLNQQLRAAYAEGRDPTTAVRAFLDNHPRARDEGVRHLLKQYALRVTWPAGTSPTVAPDPRSVAL
tara:strand:- start:162 stop:398 length:237 start_codon:yes stop_codon:yes gene_type:complete